MTLPLHPFIVHFVIALFTFSVLLDVLGFLRSRDRYHFAAWINLLGAGIAVLFAIGSGLLEESQITIPAFAKKSYEIHETTAFITAAIIIFLIFWRIGLKNQFQRKKKILYLVISVIGLTSLYIGAYHGGKLIYHYGTGIRPFQVIEEPGLQDDQLENGSSQDDIFYAPNDTLQ
jgi:uncharacterized membrane protein